MFHNTLIWLIALRKNRLPAGDHCQTIDIAFNSSKYKTGYEPGLFEIMPTALVSHICAANVWDRAQI